LQLSNDPLAQYAGVFFLALLAIATAVLWLRDRVRTGHDVASRRWVTRRAIAFLVCASPPWMAMALGNLFGEMHDPIEFLNPRRGVFAILFMAGMVWVWGALLYWLLAKGGAEELAQGRHMALTGPRISDPAQVKVFFIVCVAGGLCVLVWSIIQSL
jgi:hypothetical protein